MAAAALPWVPMRPHQEEGGAHAGLSHYLLVFPKGVAPTGEFSPAWVALTACPVQGALQIELLLNKRIQCGPE